MRVAPQAGRMTRWWRGLRWSSVTVFVVQLLLIVRGGGWCNAASTQPLAVLTSAHAVHILRSEEAARAFPVHLRGSVTYYDPFVDPNFSFIFLHDASGDIFVLLPKMALFPLRQGTQVEVTGVTEAGEYAPIVSHATVRVLDAPVKIPTAPLVNLPLLLAADYDARFVEVDGVVQAVSALKSNMVLKLATGNGVITATTPYEAGFDYPRLIDAQVRIKANAGPLFNRRRQVTGARIFFQDSHDLTVLREPSVDPFANRPRAIGDVIHIEPGLRALSMVHLHGKVALHWPGRLLCIQDSKDGLCVQTQQWDTVSNGETIDVVGFPAVENSNIGLVEARYRHAGTIEPLVPAVATVGELLKGTHAYELITIEGRLVGTNENLGESWEDPTLLIESHGRVFAAVIPRSQEKLDWHTRANGGLLRLTGVCLPETNTRHEEVGERNVAFDSFRLLLRTPADVVVLQTPTWWNRQRLFYLLQGSSAVVMAGCIWVMVLRRRVQQQTREIRESQERFRYLAEHDVLTGLANRGLLQERLEGALQDARTRRGSLALMMIDLDKFKEINDSYGHHAGDAVICAAAARISGSVRAEDTVARMGGDEFVVLLPSLADAGEASTIAERIVAAVSVPIEVEGHWIAMSASVGVCSAPGEGCDLKLLLRNCDAALYGAKARGRNCWQAFGGLAVST